MNHNKLQDEFMAFWDANKKKLGLGDYSDEILRFWMGKLEEQKEMIVKAITNSKKEIIVRGITDSNEIYNEAIDDIISLIKQI